MRTSDAGLALTKEFEGLRLEAYQDQGGVWTNGYGHTLDVREGDSVTENQANYNLAVDVEKVEDWLNNWVMGNELNQNEFDALVDFGFNLGIGALKQMLAHGWSEIPTQILRWDKSRVGGVLQPVKGLTRRREAERALFLSSAPAS